jgi:hypothetical protein
MNAASKLTGTVLSRFPKEGLCCDYSSKCPLICKAH